MAPRDLLIVGSGGLAREAAQLAGRVADRYRLVGFLDDDPSRHGLDLAGATVLGPVEAAVDASAAVVIATGSPRDFDSRRRIVERLGLPDDRFATLIDPAAAVSANCTVGAGSIVMAGCVLTSDVTAGRHVALMPQVILTHDDVVGDFVTAGAGASLAGAVTVGHGAYLGARSCVREQLRVGSGALLGMASVLLSDLPDGEVWAGLPARFLRRAAAGG